MLHKPRHIIQILKFFKVTLFLLRQDHMLSWIKFGQFGFRILIIV
jgi:hypothetical protein